MGYAVEVSARLQLPAVEFEGVFPRRSFQMLLVHHFPQDAEHLEGDGAGQAAFKDKLCAFRKWIWCSRKHAEWGCSGSLYPGCFLHGHHHRSVIHHLSAVDDEIS